MRLKVLLKFAKILMVSRLRSTRRTLVTNSLTTRPIIIALIGAGLFIIGLVFGGLTVSFIGPGTAGAQSSSQIVFTIFGGIPIFLVGFFFSMGLLWELNASSDYESTDAINWLPITASEYVLASTLSTCYTYSPLLAVVIGYALPIGLSTGNTTALLLLVAIGLVSTFIGSVGVEILRSILARASSAFTRIGGRLMIASRIIGVVLILIFTQALFSGFLIVRLISALVGEVAATSAVPIFWPTLSMTSLLAGNGVASLLYGTLSLVFLICLAQCAFSLRAKFWVMASPTIQFASSQSLSISQGSRLRRFGVSNVAAALLRREIRSAIRRKEVVRLIAIPLILPVMVIFPVIFSPAPTSTAAPPIEVNPLLLAGPLLFGVGLGALFLGMTSIGQEGGRLWSLGSLPVSAATILKCKILFSSTIAMMGLALGLATSVVVFHLDLLDAGVLAGLGLAVVLAETCLGSAVAARFADFSEGPRPRFVTMKGSILGSILGIILMGLLTLTFVGMLVLTIRLGVPLNSYFTTGLPFLAAGTIALVFSRIEYRLSIRPLQKIFADIPT